MPGHRSRHLGKFFELFPIAALPPHSVPKAFTPLCAVVIRAPPWQAILDQSPFVKAYIGYMAFFSQCLDRGIAAAYNAAMPITITFTDEEFASLEGCLNDRLGDLADQVADLRGSTDADDREFVANAIKEAAGIITAWVRLLGDHPVALREVDAFRDRHFPEI